MAFAEAITSTLQNVRGQDYLDTLTNKFILKPKIAQGIGGFLFDYEGEDSLHFQAEITDHYAEDNKVINDHIAIKPTKITLHGYVGELVQKKPFGITGILNSIQSRLTSLPGLLGTYTPAAIQKLSKVVTQTQNTISNINQSIGKIQNIVGLFTNSSPGQTNQQNAYNWLYGLFVTKQVFTVDTPYTYFDNMVIESLSIVQGEETKSWSDITVTLKQIRTVAVKVVSDPNANRNIQQAQSQVDKGKSTGTATNQSLLFQGTVGGGFTGLFKNLGWAH